MSKKAALIGYPAKHSLSPQLHRAGYAECGLDWTYENVELSPEQLGDFIASLDESWAGLSVTMPHKEALLQYGQTDELVDLVGVGNTLVYRPEGHLIRNTDVSGFVVAARRRGLDDLSSLAVLGAGATARSALAGAAQLGLSQVHCYVRDVTRAAKFSALAEKLAIPCEIHQLGDDLVPVDLLASTIPAAASEPLAERYMAQTKAVFEAVYKPWPTPLVAAAQDQIVISGRDLLAGQAVEQFELLTGHHVDLAVFEHVLETV